MSTEVTIIGSGMGALGANYFLRANGAESQLFDKGTHPGGHTYTHRYDGGWFFDEGPHVSFTSDDRVRDLLARSVNEDFVTLKANVDNYWRGYRFKHPAIRNLGPLPTDLVVKTIEDFVAAAQSDEDTEFENYEEWLRASYGDTFAETFPMQYAKKVHTTEAKNLTTDWLGPRLYRPDLSEVLQGAIASTTPDVHYVTEYRYPSSGGFYSYIEPWLEEANLRMGHELIEVDPGERRLRFNNGTVFEYSGLISTVPLPEFVPMIKGAPLEVIEAASRLTATEMVLVNIGIDRPDAGDTWTYFYDEDVVFTRVSYPASFSESMAPPGASSFQAEIYFSAKYQPLAGSPEDFIATTIEDLRKTGLIGEGDEILHQSALHVPYGNIIHDHDKAPALATIHSYLDEIGIDMAGRYGLWGYQWTDEAFKTGESAAQKALERL